MIGVATLKFVGRTGRGIAKVGRERQYLRSDPWRARIRRAHLWSEIRLKSTSDRAFDEWQYFRSADLYRLVVEGRADACGGETRHTRVIAFDVVPSVDRRGRRGPSLYMCGATGAGLHGHCIAGRDN